ncbi:MAG: hypothetical protein ACMUIA_08880 [bacterium]
MRSHILPYLGNMLILSGITFLIVLVPPSGGKTSGQGLSLSLKVPNMNISQGEIFHVDLCLDNPNHIAFDSLYVWLKYNHTALKVLEIDYDPQDLFLKEIEAQQGDSKMPSPLPFIATNRVDSFRGEIDFRIEVIDCPVIVEGVFARLTLQATASSQKAGISFQFNHRGQDPTTAILRNGQNVLDLGSLRFHGTEGIVLSIQ